MNTARVAIRNSIAPKATKSDCKLQELIDEAAQSLLVQYNNDGQVKSESTLFGTDGSRLTLSLETSVAAKPPNIALMNSWEVFRTTGWTGFSTIRVSAFLLEYVCVAVHVDGQEALLLFVLDDANKELALVTRMNVLFGGVGLNLATPSKWRGRTTTVPILDLL
jgi:hypothetical protein